MRETNRETDEITSSVFSVERRDERPLAARPNTTTTAEANVTSTYSSILADIVALLSVLFTISAVAGKLARRALENWGEDAPDHCRRLREEALFAKNPAGFLRSAIEGGHAEWTVRGADEAVQRVREHRQAPRRKGEATAIVHLLHGLSCATSP